MGYLMLDNIYILSLAKMLEKNSYYFRIPSMVLYSFSRLFEIIKEKRELTLINKQLAKLEKVASRGKISFENNRDKTKLLKKAYYQSRRNLIRHSFNLLIGINGTSITRLMGAKIGDRTVGIAGSVSAVLASYDLIMGEVLFERKDN